MHTKKLSNLATLLATFGLVFCSFQASPEDIDIFSVDENTDINNPNVLFVIENNANWTRASQQWPDVNPDTGQAEDQGQSEMFAIKTVVNELGAGINVGLFEYVTGGSAGDADFGYVRYHIRPMTATNKTSFSKILDRAYANINEPAEKRASGNPYGDLFHDIYNYLGGFQQANKGLGTPADPAAVTADTAGYTSNFDTFRSPLTTLDTCTRTIVIFISNNQSSDPTADSAENQAALHALAGGGAAGDAAIKQINFADYLVSDSVATAKAGYTDACYADATACTSDVNADPACTEEGFLSCSCDAADAFGCPTTHFTVVGTDNQSASSAPTTQVTQGAPTGEIGATCKTEGQIPVSASCPSPSTAVDANTPDPGTTRTTETSWADCKYVLTDTTGCGASKANYEIRGTRTDVITDTFTKTTQTTLGETNACYAGVGSCNPADGSWNCADFNGGCTCTTPGDTTGCAAGGTKRFQILGQYNRSSATQTSSFSAAPSTLYLLDEWARFLRQRGVPIPGLTTRAQVTTYTIDVFNANQNAVQSALLFNAARVGGGAYFQAKNRNALINALRQILTEVQAVNSAFSSASLPVNATNRAQNENQVFIGVFKPDRTKDPGWFGNMKRYQLISTGSTIDLGDALEKPAINTQTGFLTDCAVSFWTRNSGEYWTTATSDDPDALSICATNATSDWSDLPDGPFVEKGAVAEVIRMGNTVGSPDAAGNYLVNRDVYTVSAGALVDLTAATFDDGDATSDETVEGIIVRYIRGEDIQDEDADANAADPANRGTIEPRSTVHGDVVHSRPQPINYGGDPDTGTGVVVFYGSNDGHFRAVRAKTGEELWSFVAPESFPKFVRLVTNKPIIQYFGDSPINAAPKDYFFDGSTGVFQNDDNSKIWIFPTLRRGGNRLYGLNVTEPDKPAYMWSAGCDSTGCPDEFKFMGQTWGLPNVAFIKGYCGSSGCTDATTPRAPVIVLAGGYDKCDDENTWSPGCSAATGTGVFVLDAETGKLVRYFDFSLLTGFAARSVAADVALIDIDSDSMVDYGFAVDTGGNVYRFDFIDGPTSKVAIDDPTKWPYSRVAFTNGGGRKFLFPPALVQVTSSKLYLAIGSGDREHPLRSHYPFADRNSDGDTSDGGVINRFYVFKDDLTEVDETTALDLDGASMVDHTKDSGCAADQVLPGDAEKGWFLELGAAGQGEQVVTSAVVAAGFVFFSTNRPTATSTTACTTSLGEARGYFLNLLNASGAIGVAGACGGTRSSTFVGGGLPPSPVLATVPIGGELRTVVIGAVQKTGEPSSPIQSQRVRPPIASDRRPIYWYKSTGDK